MTGPGRPEAPPDVTGSWVHAFEEDTPAETVYRRADPDHPFPPARRPRRRIEFRPDGTYTERRPARDDRLNEARGRWEARGADRIAVTFPDGGGSPFTLTVLSRTPGRLVLAR
ncbi:hypothetical protein ETD83_01045 [Actinomadura soli]|uniref:Uncharacterized protein n=1 Tax=Actinomadura soli TaxID=2508997 RepID=A0A5C4JKD8_9ACTN|nr:hypothetical protein [Actinomadura soli]TMR07363.1 hypothetical protein ETD83_01045 [Actinomadura soli]